MRKCDVKVMCIWSATFGDKNYTNVFYSAVCTYGTHFNYTTTTTILLFFLILALWDVCNWAFSEIFSILFFADFFLPFDKDFLWMFSRQLSFPFNWDKENGTMQISPDTIRLSSIFQLFMNSNNSFTIPVLKYFVTTPAVKGKVSWDFWPPFFSWF